MHLFQQKESSVPFHASSSPLRSPFHDFSQSAEEVEEVAIFRSFMVSREEAANRCYEYNFLSKKQPPSFSITDRKKK